MLPPPNSRPEFAKKRHRQGCRPFTKHPWLLHLDEVEVEVGGLLSETMVKGQFGKDAV
jgi:hypothetical protein